MIKNNINLNETFVSAYQNHTQNKLEKAEELYKQVLKTHSNHLQSIFLLGSLYIQKRNFNLSIKLLKKAIALNPNFGDAFHNLGFAYVEMGELEEGIKFFNKTIELNPKHPDVYYNLGNTMKQMGELKNSKDYYLKSIQIQPKSNAYNNLGNIYKQLGDFNKAIDSYNQSIKILENNSNAHFNLGNIYKQLGDFNKAQESYKKALLSDPNNLETIYNLSEINDKVLSEDLKERLLNIREDEGTTSKNIAYKNFLLAKYELRKKKYEKEFNYLLKGHTNYLNVRKLFFEKGIKYQLNELPKISELEEIDPKKYLAINKNEKIKPIFIIGVPRCGSTLIEKIIASGKTQIPIGEETGIFSLIVGQKVIKKKSIPSDLKNFKEEIIEKYEEKNLIKKKFNYTFTDKSLDNFLFIGLIRSIFPKAKIINCQRSPSSSIISIIKNNLGQVSWAHDLENIFTFFDIYFKKINKFKSMYPNFIYDLNFEKFVSNPEEESKKVMKFCEISWDKKCLEFYKRKDIVSHTASSMQIRKPIYTNAKNNNAPYKKFIQKYGEKYSWFN